MTDRGCARRHQYDDWIHQGFAVGVHQLEDADGEGQENHHGVHAVEQRFWRMARVCSRLSNVDAWSARVICE